MLLQYRFCHIEFSPSVVITESRQNASPLLSYGDGLYAFNLWMKQFSLMWLASSSASSNPLILIFYFFIYLIQKLRQKEVDEESCVKTCSMNWGEANSVYTSYIVSSASNGKIQAGALIFVLVGYIVSNSICHHIGGRLWRLDELAYGIPSDGPYQTNPPSIEDIILSIRIDREGQARRIRHEKEIDVHDYQILTREIIPTLKPLDEIIRENVFCLGVIGIMFPRVFILCFTVLYTPKDSILPITWQNEWSRAKTRRDRGMRRGRHSTSSSAFNQPSLSHLKDDDDDGNDEGTSRASTPSPIRYVNSLTNQFPQIFQNPPNIDPHLEPFYTRQTKIINRQVQLRDDHRGGVRSIGKSLRRLWRNIKK
ncbi:hypothetical protein Tco_0355094 [Tanacetum coccineum]